MNGRDILTTAVEGGIGYWATVTASKRAEDLSWLEVTLEPAGDPDEFKPVTVKCGSLPEALRSFAKAHPKTRTAEYVKNDDIDAEAADVAVQVAAFGEVVYG